MFISEAIAQTAPAAATSSSPMGGGGISTLLMFGGVLVLMYFMTIRPQMKRQKEHKAMIDAIAKGDEVVVGGGILGKVAKIGETFLHIEVANGVELQVQRSSVLQVLPKGSIK